jgi:hypothetical protein
MGEAAYLFAMDIRDKKGYRCFATPNMERTYVFLPVLNSTREEENPAEETDADQRMLALRKFHQWQLLSCSHTICVRRHIKTIGFQWPDGIRPGVFEPRRGDTRKPGRPKIYPQRTSKYTRDGEYDYFPELPDEKNVG